MEQHAEELPVTLGAPRDPAACRVKRSIRLGSLHVSRKIQHFAQDASHHPTKRRRIDLDQRRVKTP
jgi:hypothetical protein